MTDKKFSPPDFDLRTSSVDPSLPLLFRIGIVDGAASDMQVIYVGMSRDGAKAPFSNYDGNLRRMQDGRAPRNGKRFRQLHRDIDIGGVVFFAQNLAVLVRKFIQIKYLLNCLPRERGGPAEPCCKRPSGQSPPDFA